MLPDIKINDRVSVHSTSDPRLDGQTGIVKGVYAPEYLIVIFDNEHIGEYYDPAKVMSIYCLQKIQN